jgi:hypothetical protein
MALSLRVDDFIAQAVEVKSFDGGSIAFAIVVQFSAKADKGCFES